MVDDELMAMAPNIHMPMLQTAEVVADRYNVSRDAMDEYGLQSQQRTAEAYAAALDLAYTACGIFDGFFEFRLSPWDLAAGTLLVEEAGGTVSDMHGGDGFLASGDIVCGPSGVHAELLRAIAMHRALWDPDSNR